jgi:hypothetical protein
MRNVPLDFALGWAALRWPGANGEFMAISILRRERLWDNGCGADRALELVA